MWLQKYERSRWLLKVQLNQIFSVAELIHQDYHSLHAMEVGVIAHIYLLEAALA